MRLLTFQAPDGLRLGLLTEGGILDVAFAAASLQLKAPATLPEVMAGGLESLARLARAAAGRPGLHLAPDTVRLGPCVPNPPKLIGIGMNYRQHAEETGAEIPKVPILFSKYGLTITGHGAEVELPEESSQVDYEGELAIVIGRQGRKLTLEEAPSVIFGYCIGIDFTARDLQFRTSQWLLGKSCEGFNPIGPYLVTADEVRDPQALQLQTWVNGELRQDSTTADMIFPCAALVSYVSRYMPLEPGDVIMTGTPAGVALGRPAAERERFWLKEGDLVEVAVTGLGRLQVSMRASKEE